FGWVLLQKGQVGHAVDEIQKALAIDPNLALAHYNLGNALVQKGQISDAIAQFQEALHLNPNLPNAQDHLIKAQAMIRQQMNPK
ncbi:MAG TPA: tetratricopeptide repeat protein, partial [Candidatus Methylacidiphilales bacterium]|nr:tetratricopeptide repeat protein [Candidatus Methylacidiphilales bacterium]